MKALNACMGSVVAVLELLAVEESVLVLVLLVPTLSINACGKLPPPPP